MTEYNNSNKGAGGRLLPFHNRYPFTVYLYEIYAIGQVRNVDGCAVAVL